MYHTLHNNRYIIIPIRIKKDNKFDDKKVKNGKISGLIIKLGSSYIGLILSFKNISRWRAAGPSKI